MAQVIRSILRADGGVTLLRGRRDGLEVMLAGRDLAPALDELEALLARQPAFYRGSKAVANFGAQLPSASDLAKLAAILSAAGVELRSLSGSASGLEDLARAGGLECSVEAPAPSIEASALSEGARSLVADFAGARNDIAMRRKRGESSVRRAKIEPKTPPQLRLVEAPPGTLYHAATLRGGQTLHHSGNIVVVGDVNPGAELVATGDIVVFGRLAGTAHAGAQGDASARIFAIELAATQLRIATFIAAQERPPRRGAPKPEAAFARDGGIAIVALEELGSIELSGVSPS